MSGLTGLPVKAKHSNAVLIGESSGVNVVDNQSTGKGGIVDLALTLDTRRNLALRWCKEASTNALNRVGGMLKPPMKGVDVVFLRLA